MSDETYYTVLNVKETASASEIKTAYRDLIKQVHPDTIANLAPYLRKIAEDKAKELTEAYAILSNASKRRDYDRQIREYRRQTTPQSTPAPPTPPPPPQSTAPRPLGYKLGQKAATLMRWSFDHPKLAAAIAIGLIAFVSTFFINDTPSEPAATATTASSLTNSVKPTSTATYSQYPCDHNDKVSPIDGKPCGERQEQSVPAPPPGFTVDKQSTVAPTAAVSGSYVGTVHNQTVNLSSTFTVVIHQTKGGLLDGCVEVKPPLYGSGVVRGSIRGSHVNFVVADITFQGEASKTGIAGSYVVTRSDGNQLGDFRLSKWTAAKTAYGCSDGAVVEFEVVDSPPKPKPVKTPAATVAVVTSDYATIEKRCAFLPFDNYGRCNYQPETVARPRKSDRLTVLSPLTRAENGEDIYKVRTAQGWVGWINSNSITIQAP